MIQITINRGGKPSSERAIAFAKRLLENKKIMIEEMKDDFKKPEFQDAIKQLRELNAKDRK